MKISYKELNTFFDNKLPSVEEVIHAFTFHAWEIEDVETRGDDTIMDVKVLPDKSSWALSYRGIATDLSVILDIPLAFDPLSSPVALEPHDADLTVRLDTPACTRYTASRIEGVTVGSSPLWLKEVLESVGQRSINNIVDATNYVMFRLGQPLHAFDAGKLAGTEIGVRFATQGEPITTLSGDELTLSSEDVVIVDGTSDTPIGIGGVKGGVQATIDSETTNIILESAHFDAVTIRKTAGRLKLRTDASKRFENGIVSAVAPIALKAVTELILDIGGGELRGYVDTGFIEKEVHPVTVYFEKVNRVLGLTLSPDQITKIIERFGYAYALEEDRVHITPPFERTDLTIQEDFIEEIGRVHGYDHVEAIVPEPIPVTEINSTFYYVNAIREALITQNFSEVLTSSFREYDVVALANAFASDKGYLRSSLRRNMEEVLAKNAHNGDLLGLQEIRAFEIGTVFLKESEELHIVLGVCGPNGYKEKIHGPILRTGMEQVDAVFGNPLTWNVANGIAEASLTYAIGEAPVPFSYTPVTRTLTATYAPYSPYPFVSRDIAFWVSEDTTIEEIEKTIRAHAGALLVRLSLFDEFKKEGRVSYAFRLVFQSFEKTLTDAEVVPPMEAVTQALQNQGFEIR
jgi:phenylalanyl-tRNA synthetase beta chain